MDPFFLFVFGGAALFEGFLDGKDGVSGILKNSQDHYFNASSNSQKIFNLKEPTRFFPSEGQTLNGELLPPEPFLGSQSCGFSGCHSDIYHQWESSVHRFASFNNPFYRKTVEVVAKERGFTATKFCGGCHDPVLLFSGRMDSAIEATSKEAQAGIACLSCHAIRRILGAKGNAGYQIDLPIAYPFASSDKPFLQLLHRVLIRVKPVYHRRSLLKPFHQDSEFCGTCHKVSIDIPVNGYRWKRGQNEYDSWQMSAISGQIAAPLGDDQKEAQTCQKCHMPKTLSNDINNKNGKILSHRFSAANTAIPHVNRHDRQLREVINYLKEKQITMSLVATRTKGKDPSGEKRFSSLVEGENLIQWIYPLDIKKNRVVCGDIMIFELLLKNKNVGHAFPGGTIDAQEVWIEFQVMDETRKTIYHSGFLKPDGQVDPKAHFYGALLLDGKAEPILHRNIQSWVATAYQNTISPGGADIVQFKVNLPQECGKYFVVNAKLHYRKFRPEFTEFVFPVGEKESFDGDSFPIATMAETEFHFSTVSEILKQEGLEDIFPKNIGRLNDYGLALFLQGDHRRASDVFGKALKLDENNSEARVRLVRVLLAEGLLDEARYELGRLLEINPKSTKGIFLKGVLEKEFGHYSKALKVFESLASGYPRDRSLWKQIGQTQLLMGLFQEADHSFQQVLNIDPEDTMAHYHRAISLEGYGKEEEGGIARALYQKYRVDENEESIAAVYRRKNFEVNREAQKIHLHD